MFSIVSEIVKINFKTASMKMLTSTAHLPKAVSSDTKYVPKAISEICRGFTIFCKSHHRVSSGNQKPINIATFGFRKLICDRTSGILNLMNHEDFRLENTGSFSQANHCILS